MLDSDKVVNISSEPLMHTTPPVDNELVIGIVADFNPHNLARLLERNCLPFRARCHAAAFAQSLPILLTPASEFWETKCDAVMIWTFPELAVPEFSKALNWLPFSLEDALAQVVEFVSL